MKVLFIPSVSVGNGTGHLRRCLELVSAFPAGRLLIEPIGVEETRRARAVVHAAGIDGQQQGLVSTQSNEEKWQVVVIDRRSTSSLELDKYSSYGPVVAVDEGGEARRLAPYLIDTLPLPAGTLGANVFSTAFQTRPLNRRKPGDPATGRILITFGGEDRSSLSARLSKHLVEGGYFPPERLTLVRGPLFRPQSYPDGIEFLDAPSDLRERLHEFDLVFTSFGLTAYEAANAGVSVILFNPTPYHRTLARIAGFAEIGVRRVRGSALRGLLADPRAVRDASGRAASGEQRSIAEHLSGLDFSRGGVCPACGSSRRVAIGRFPDRSFFRCEGCTMVYELDFSPSRRRYDEAYFFEDYRKQYGRTYLEDFENLRRYGSARLDKLDALGVSLAGKRLVDVGCAYGAFLVEAGRRGAEVYGIDVADAAVDYVTKSLSIRCERSSIEELDLEASFFVKNVDIVTMWYVIEHLAQLGRVLAKINTILPMGGIFAFSTPNLAGISGRVDLKSFLANSPYDHFTIWDPRIARRVLARFGFRVRKTHVTGHHPERFRIPGSSAGWKYKLLSRYSQLTRLGDTFECYAEKVSEWNQ